MPDDAVLAALMIISFAISHSDVQIEGLDCSGVGCCVYAYWLREVNSL